MGEIIPVYSGGVGVSKLFIAAGIRDFLRGGMYFDYKSMKKAAKREIRIFRNVEHVIGTSKFDEDEFRRVNKKADYHHLDLILRKEFYDWNWSRTKSLNLVTISNEYSYKGFDLILKTVEELICRGIQFKWVVIGISPSGSFFKLYKKLFRDSKLWEHVSLPGALSVSEILKHFNEGFYM
ncbi:MAG: glycosyltransferase [Ignavibacteriales bacterium]|nr:glycosyltransferase [Ignavibacteriales bacterium]